MKKILAIIVFTLAYINIINAQLILGKLKGKVPPVVCYASGKTEKINIPPPAGLLLKSGDTKLSQINVTYSLFPDTVKAAFEFAINIWEHMVKSDIPINVQANWRSQTQIHLEVLPQLITLPILTISRTRTGIIR